MPGRTTLYLINASLIVLGLYFGAEIFIPFCYAILFMLLLMPLCRKLESYKVPRVLAIFITLIIVFSILGIITTILIHQFIDFTGSLSKFTERINIVFRNMQGFLKRDMGITLLGKYKNAQSGLAELLNNQAGLLSNTLSVTTGLLINVAMVVVYTFLLLLYRSSFYQFCFNIFPAQRHEAIAQVLQKIQKLIQSYIVGLLSVIGIVAVLDTAGLALFGIDNAVFLGALAAIFIILPYIGVFIGAILPVLMAIVTKDSGWYAVGVMGLFLGVHFLESNFITPYFVGKRVSINPLTTIMGIIVGNMIWGINGMVLAIPMIAILKAVFDSIDALKPLGYLLGKEISDKETDMDSIFAAFKINKKKKS